MDEKDYTALLDNALSKLPEDAMRRDRFNIPEASILSEGNKTFIKNFKSISEKLKRDSKHFLKYLLNEIGTRGDMDEASGRVILQGKFSKRAIHDAIESYVKEFILCETCKKPDTVIERQGRQYILVCHACGARQSVRRI
ncbi:MAG: translation initiation factor IF-2 subunit beta [Candidatus Hodarchaeota archaeon]